MHLFPFSCRLDYQYGTYERSYNRNMQFQHFHGQSWENAHNITQPEKVAKRT